jgi:iron(III) transport system ATP-binding protein
VTAQPDGTALQLHRVTKRFGRIVAVDGVSLRVAPGELAVLVGPSGCGKSTLLRLVAGLHEVDEGTIEIEGRTVDDGGRVVLAPEHRKVGLVFQEHALFPHLSVADNVMFGLRRDGRRKQRTQEMLELVGLQALAARYPHELSGGERQRVALARALAPRPALLLLDEPFASLDANLRSRLRRDVTAILRAAKMAAVFVTHDQSEALAVGDRIAVMHAGAIVQFDDPATVFHEPATRFVASFMGEADFLGAAGLSLIAPGCLPVDGPASSAVMVRPDDLELSLDPGSGAVVVDAEFRGASWCYTVALPSGESVRSIRSHLSPLAIGTAVRVGLVPGHQPARIDEPGVPPPT